MKRFIAVLSGLLVLPAFAEVAPVFYDEIVEYTDEMLNAEDAENPIAENETIETKKTVAPRTTANRSSSRTMSASNNSQVIQRAVPSTRAMASSVRNAQKISRGTVSRTPKTAGTTTVQSRSSRSGVTSRSAQSSKPVTARASVTGATVASIKNTVSANQVNQISDSGEALYLPTDTGVARVGVGSRRASARIASPATATTPVVTEEDVSSTASNLAKIAELTDYCKSQYASCMDNYCNILDDNQGRCSCSKNLKNYEKTEEALATATENFKDVVQKIKYIGLTSDQVTSLFSETEAELTMKSKTDSSQIKNSLDAIKKQIIDASSPTSSVNTSGVSMDLSGLLNADFTSGFDLSSFLGTWAATNGASSNVSNQRGETLYKTATQRCKIAVLNSCTAQGIDANLITNSYDLEIDKQCIVYERSLNEANAEMKSNVTNATTILQQARLLLMQNKNAYDLRGCVAAIDACMQDEYVCGSDYELCLDPTGKYLASGEVVKGGTPGISGGNVANTQDITESTLSTWTSKGMYELYGTWNYNESGVSAVPGDGTLNAWGGGRDENLGNYINVALDKWAKDYKKSEATDDMATYILQKVGYIDSDDKTHGMCSSIMKQCQDYTYNQKRANNKNYLPSNEVIRQYLASALTKIKLQQDSILADYAEGCRGDVSSCLSTNGYDELNTSTTASQTAVNACRAEIATCMSVGGQKPSDPARLTLRAMRDWVASMLKTCAANYYLTDRGQGSVTCEPCGVAAKYSSTGTSLGGNIALESSGGQETTCHCPDGYTDYHISTSTGLPDKCMVSE